MSQAVDTERIKIDDRCWHVRCAECDEWFYATRSDASFCKPAHRKRYFERPARFQNAMLELSLMGRRAREISEKYKSSQRAYDEMVSLAKQIDKALQNFEIEWKQTSF